MSKVYLTEQMKLNETFEKIVYHAMVDRSIKNETELLKSFRFCRQTGSAKLKSPDKFTYGELVILDRILKFSDADILKMFGRNEKVPI